MIGILRHKRKHIVLVYIYSTWYDVCIVDVRLCCVEDQLLPLVLSHRGVPIRCRID